MEHTDDVDCDIYNTDCYPPVLDVCCGSRMFWFDKTDNRAVFHDVRNESYEVTPNRGWPNGTTIEVRPDVTGDFRTLQFANDTFHLVVFDPPHMRDLGKGLRKNGIMARRYGLLFEDWRSLLAAGFSECFRVLRPGGTLIFKWCSVEIPLTEVLALTNERPLFGHRSGAKLGTHWVAFLKPLTESR